MAPPSGTSRPRSEAPPLHPYRHGERRRSCADGPRGGDGVYWATPALLQIRPSGYAGTRRRAPWTRPCTSEELAQIDISKEEKDKLVAEVMRYMLFKSHQTSGCPIKREELTGVVTKNYRQRALPTLVINEARDRLAATFGYEMRELQRTRAPSARPGRPSQPLPYAEAKSYILVSQLDNEVFSKYVEDKEAAPLSGFAFTVISVIHLAGGKIPEEDLWHQLKRLGLKSDSDEKHPALGNNKQALELLVQQRYLLKEKLAVPEGHVVMYELAERALDESISGSLKGYISQIVGTSTVAEENSS